MIQFSDSTRSTYSPCSCRRHRQFLFNPTFRKSEVFLRTSHRSSHRCLRKLKIHDTRHMQVWCQKTSTAQSTQYSHFNQSKQDARKRQDRSPLERKEKAALTFSLTFENIATNCYISIKTIKFNFNLQ